MRRLTSWILRVLPFLVLFATMWFVASRRVDGDFGWHYRSGEYILAHGVPRHDIFTYTAVGFEWINHEWLYDMMVYAGAHWLGYGLLAGVFAALWVAALGVSTRWRLSVAVAGLAMAALFPYIGVRPVVWTVLLLAVTLRLVEARHWAWLPLVFAVWANLHGGFVVGLGAMGVYMVAQRTLAPAKWLALSALATCLNPYGPQVYVEIWRTLTDPHLHAAIVEWMPLEAGYTNAPYILAAILCLTLLRTKLLYRRWLGAGLVLAVLSATRQMPVLVVATLAQVQQGYDAILDWVRRHQLRPWAWRLGMTAVGVVIGIVGVLWPIKTAGTNAAVMPVRSVLELQHRPCEGRLFNHYSYGGYLVKWLPEAKIYIDGRMPSWSGPEGRYLDRWMRVMTKPDYADSEFERFNIRCVIITKADTVLGEHLAKTGWRPAVREESAVLWRRD